MQPTEHHHLQLPSISGKIKFVFENGSLSLMKFLFIVKDFFPFIFYDYFSHQKFYLDSHFSESLSTQNRRWRGTTFGSSTTQQYRRTTSRLINYICAITGKYRHSSLSILDGTISVPKEHIISLKPCSTIQLDNLWLTAYTLLLIKHRHSPRPTLDGTISIPKEHIMSLRHCKKNTVR